MLNVVPEDRKSPWVEVVAPVEAGSAGSLDRRTHFVEMGPLWIRTRVSGLDGGGLPRTCLTYHDLRRATSAGHWARSRQRGQDLRSAAEIIPHFDPEPAGILTGLSLAEAEALAEHAGARLPTQKELSVILEHEKLPELRAALPPNTGLWTSSVYHMLDYSHCRYNLVEARWEADSRVQLPQAGAVDNRNAAGGTLRSVLEPQAGRVLRHAAPAGTRAIALSQNAALALAALLVMEKRSQP